MCHVLFVNEQMFGVVMFSEPERAANFTMDIVETGASYIFGVSSPTIHKPISRIQIKREMRSMCVVQRRVIEHCLREVPRGYVFFPYGVLACYEEIVANTIREQINSECGGIRSIALLGESVVRYPGSSRVANFLGNVEKGWWL